jgi:hypothetical protein
MFVTFHDQRGKEVHVVISKVKTVEDYVYGSFRTRGTKITFVDDDTRTVTEDVAEVRRRIEGATKK